MTDTIALIVREHIIFRKQILMLSKSDLVKTYRGAALGWSWAIVKPTMTLFVFWFAFTIGLRSGKPVEGYPFFLWLVSGMVAWFYMSEMITGGAGCIRKYRHLVTKMKFPISVIPTFFSLSHLYVHLVLFTITVFIFMAFGFMPTVYLLQIPFYMLLMFLFTVTWSLLTGMLSAISLDFKNLVGSISTAIFWMSGVLYDVNKIGSHTMRLILKLNPVTFIATGYRNCFIYHKWFFEEPQELLCFIVVFMIFLISALLSFKNLRKEIVDVL